MSILNGTRLNFWGGIRTDVSVPNNSPSIAITVDDQPTKLNLFDLSTSTVAAEAASYTDDQLNGFINAPSPSGAYTAGGWNHYGQHVVDMQAQISSQGAPGSVGTTGDQVGQPVYLLGSVDPVTGQVPFSGPMMVDLDPSSSTTTQIFVGGLQIGVGDSIQLLIRHDTVCSNLCMAQRVLGPAKMDAPGSCYFSGTFQLTFPLSSIVSYNQDSPALKSIIEAPGATGIVVRFVMFEMCPNLTTAQLDADYAANQSTANPSVGRVIGTLAPAFAGEPLSCPDGRLLINQQTGNVGYAGLSGNDLLSIDMVNLVPQQTFRAERTNITSPIGPNADYGSISISAGATLTTLQPTDPALQDYYLYGGIVDVPLSEAQVNQVKSTALSLTAPNQVMAAWRHQTTSLNVTESVYRLYAEQLNVYLDDYPYGLGVELQVRYLGAAVPDTVQVRVRANSSGIFAPVYCLGFPGVVNIAPGQLSVTVPVTVAAGSEDLAGFAALNFYVYDGQPITDQTSPDFFSNFRKYADTDFGIAKGSTITWDQVYTNVLRFHYLAFPAMSRYVPLNQPDALMNSAKVIVARTSEAYKGTTLFMPVVRSMSPSQRALLKAWLTSTPWT